MGQVSSGVAGKVAAVAVAVACARENGEATIKSGA